MDVVYFWIGYIDMGIVGGGFYFWYRDFMFKLRIIEFCDIYLGI